MKVLLPVDGSEYSNKAVSEVVRRPWPEGTQVEVLSVAQPVPEFPDTQLMGHTVYLDSLEREMKRAQASVTEAAAAIARAFPQLDVTTKVVDGEPKAEILREATSWDADLIVMGSHGYGAAMRFLMGSISHAIALHAPCSVEIVRSRKTAPPAKS